MASDKQRKSDPAAQYQSFVEAARKLGCDDSEQAFVDKLRQLARAPVKPKSAPRNKAKPPADHRGS